MNCWRVPIHIIDSLPKAEGSYAMVMACVRVCLCMHLCILLLFVSVVLLEVSSMQLERKLLKIIDVKTVGLKCISVSIVKMLQNR